jgi:hypothetical protein
MLANKKPHLIVVTDAFDTFYPLVDFVQARNGKVSLAFFMSGLEPRWQRAGLYGENCPVRFVDLDPYAKSILGVDLGSGRGVLPSKSGLANLKI